MSYGSSVWRPWVIEDEERCLSLMKTAYDNGIRTFDTANVYSNGVSEKLVGKFIKKYNIPRQKLVILTKCGLHMGDETESLTESWAAYLDPLRDNEHGLSRKHIFDAVEASVERLGTYIDVFQIHRMDTDVPKEEIMGALNDVVKSGKVRYIGASSMRAYQFVQLQNVAEARGWPKFISMQNYYHMLYREEEREMIPYCKETGVGLIPWSALARGLLARPYGSEKTDRQKSESLEPALTPDVIEIIKRVETLAKEHSVSMAVISIAWTLAKGAVPILGLSSEQRIIEAASAVSFKLTDKEIAYLDEPYQPKPVSGIDIVPQRK